MMTENPTKTLSFPSIVEAMTLNCQGHDVIILIFPSSLILYHPLSKEYIHSPGRIKLTYGQMRDLDYSRGSERKPG